MNIEQYLPEQSKMYVIEVRRGQYVKNAKHDATNIENAKFFDSEEKAERYIRTNLPYGATIKLVDGQQMNRQILTPQQQRLKDETQELAAKTNKVQDYMRTKHYYELTRNEKDLLYMQLHAMLTYLEALGKRCEYYGIKLDINGDKQISGGL